MRVDISPLRGKLLEVAAVVGEQTTPKLADELCGCPVTDFFHSSFVETCRLEALCLIFLSMFEATHVCICFLLELLSFICK